MERTFKSEIDLSKFKAISESFWDVGNYRKVVKRIDDGLRLCNELIKMAQEKAEIESRYAKSLQNWSKKWEDIVIKGPEYGSLEVGWKANLYESEKIADIHLQISKRISDEIVEGILAWKNSHFHKSIVHLKETKKAEDGFTAAQKPWSKRLFKCIRAKKAYHHSAKEVHTLANQVHIADVSPEISAEQCQKLRAKHEKAEAERDRLLEKYKDRLGDVQRYISRYDEDMTMQFSKCQEAEQARMFFFKTAFFKLHKILSITTSNRLKDIYAEFEKNLDEINPIDDLRWYAMNYGTGMPYNWPEFEPFQKEQLPVIAKQSPRASNHKPSSINMGSMLPHLSEESHNSSSNYFFNPSAEKHRMAAIAAAVESEHDNKEEEKDWLEPPPAEYTSGQDNSNNSGHASEEPKGKLMRALYDYSRGKSDDDLDFREGDLIRIMTVGENGWAEGSMGDMYGYVPISYFEDVH